MERGILFSNWGKWSAGTDATDLTQVNFDFGSHGQVTGFMGWDGIILRDDSVSVVDMCRAYIERAKQESCGQCFPCRLGTEEMHQILERICQGQGRQADLDRLRYLATVLKDTSKCGIGETTPRPVLDAMDNFPQSFEQAVTEQKPIPAGEYAFRVTAPCTNACPSHLDIPKYVEKIWQGDFKGSLQVVRNDCPMPSTIGRVCVRPCEMNCRRTKLDEPIAIKALKRFVADPEQFQGRSPDVQLPESKEGKVAIVGAGPAGLSCAYYLGLRGIKSTIFESLPEPGGMAAVGIPDYRLPRPILHREAEIVEGMGCEIRYNVNVGQDITIDDMSKQGYKAVFVGVGAPESSKMRCEGEDAGYQCFMTGVEFLRLIAMGQKPLEGKKMVVIGGGNVAMDCVRSAKRLGFEDVNLIYRRTEKEMPADPVEIKEAKEEGVNFNYLIQPVTIHAEQGKVTGLECLKMELGEPDASGRRRPVPVKGSNFIIDCDAIIPAIGQTCVVDCVLPDDAGVELTKWKSLVVDEITFQSGQEHIFGGGDCITGPDTLIAALAAGKHAAKYIAKYMDQGRGTVPSEIQDHMDKLIGELKVFYPFEKLPYKGYAKRAKQKALDPEERIKSFDEVEAGFKQTQAVYEATRCLRCYRLAMAAL